MKPYYIELARTVLNDAVGKLRSAEQFIVEEVGMVKTEDAKYFSKRVSRIIKSTEKLNKELGDNLIEQRLKTKWLNTD